MQLVSELMEEVKAQAVESSEKEEEDTPKVTVSV